MLTFPPFTQDVFNGVRRRKKSHILGVIWVDVFKENSLFEILPKLRKMAIDSEGFSFIGSSFSKQVWMIQNALKEESNQLDIPVISKSRFLRILENSGIKSGAAAEEAICFLHDLGSLIHFGEIGELKEFVVLEPLFLQRIMISLFKCEIVSKNGGAFIKRNMAQIWPQNEFRKESYGIILRFLYAFELIARNVANTLWLVKKE